VAVDPELIAIGKQAAPGVLGSITAVRFVGGPLLARLAMVPSGAALSWYAAPWVALKVGTPEGLSGFLVGLFGMVVVGKLFDTWERFDVSGLLQRWLDRWFGPRPPTPPSDGGPQP
jgi:hypothetical protein